MKAPYQVLQKELECLRETQHGLPVNGEGGNLLSVEIHDLAGVGRGVIGADHLQGLVPVVVEVSHGGAQEEV